ncbi:MAG TPA: TIGR04551 family protein [Anaeromyxobacteraceae bacterium]|nr:TIGR04551 family protein [Anaeromyxobacteraceae bacterium]
MSRLPAAALAALLLLPGAVRAQAKAAPPPAPAPKDDATATAQQPDAEVDPKTREAIQKAVQKAKDELRDEVRAEIQGAQSATEFMGAVAEGPKLQFLQLDGYLRVRGQLFNGLDLGRGPDATGHRLFPVPLQGTNRSTLASANMRLRIEPTLNVSESVRVKAQLDVLDNYVLGSSTSTLFDRIETGYGSSFYGASRNITGVDPTADRGAIIPRRAWGEVQTPVGLLSFGRMPSEWGLGIFTTAGRELNADFGDTVDRIQFALPPVQTPIGKLTFVPILDFDSEGVLNADTHFGPGFGQPFDAESGDDARTYAIKVARLDTDDEIRRKLERNETSFNFGAYYNYRTQRWTYPAWKLNGYSGSYADTGDPSTEPAKVRRGAYVHVIDVWARLLRGRWRIEAEAVGVGGHIGEVFTYGQDPNDATKLVATSLGRALLRQWGGVLLAEFKAIPNKVTLGAELGMASADSAPGFGVDTTRTATDASGNTILPPYGSIDGPQSGQPGDNAIRNYRFNPGYQVDLILWRELVGQVTEAWYLKPKIRWDILPGLTFDGAIIYSQMLNASGPDAAAVDPTNAAGAYSLARGGSKPLGAEVDGKLTLDSGNGFAAWTEVGFLQPFGGLGSGLSRAWALGFGLAAKF